MSELAVIVPTRGRPGNIERLIDAWTFTGAWSAADLILAVDRDDPEFNRYEELVYGRTDLNHSYRLMLFPVPTWVPMVHKLNEAAVHLANLGNHFALGFAGDDHVPETINWAQRYLTILHELGTGMVYGDDGYQGAKLSTEWAVTADTVRALGRMVPAPVEHMYCDNSMMDLFNGAGMLRHLPEIRIEHRHPIVGKAETDDQYKRVNHRDQFSKDRKAYERWRASGMVTDINTIRALNLGAPEFHVEPVKPKIHRPPTPRTRGVIRRSGPSVERINAMSRFPFSQELKQVRGATPDEIGMTLADFASVVPADQEIVELGVFNGRTALIMAWGAKQGHGAHVTGIDPWDLEGNVYDPPFTDVESKNWAHYWVRTLGYSDRITLINAFSHQVSDDWTGGCGFTHRPVGLLFVDGDHTREGARRDIEGWAPHLAPGAVIAVDDYGHPDWPGVGEAVDELVSEGLLEPIEIYHDRLAVTRLVAANERPATGMLDNHPITAITSEGVSPSPVKVTLPDGPGFDGVTAYAHTEDPRPVVAPHASPVRVRDAEDVELPDMELDPELEAEWRRVDPEGVSALERSAEDLTRKSQVQFNELGDVESGTPIEDLNLVNLKALAKHRGIVLGSRKDKRSEIIEALRAGE